MGSIIENQYVEKRRKNSQVRHNCKSAGYNSQFMELFNQKPVQLKRRRPAVKNRRSEKYSDSRRRIPGSVEIPLSSILKNIFKKKPKRRRETRGYESRIQTEERQKGKGLVFNIPLATLAAAAGTAVIALAALNWDGLDFEIRTPETFFMNPAEDQAVEARIIIYAETGIPGIIGGSLENLEELRIENSALVEIIVNAETANPRGLLQAFEWQQYRVQRGDTVSGIALKYRVSVGAIIASNDISNARRLQEGAVIRIPNIDGIPYQVQSGDSLSKIAASFNVPLEVILDVNEIKSDNIRLGETIFIPGARMNDIDLRMSLGDLFAYPLQNRHITSNYGMRKDPISGALQFHAGVDFRANTGTTVMASFDGIVSAVGENWLYGKYIILTHSNGYKTLYGHLNAFSVKQGDRVIRGRKIGETGNTGYSTGPHLHFGIYDQNNKLVNPLELLN